MRGGAMGRFVVEFKRLFWCDFPDQRAPLSADRAVLNDNRPTGITVTELLMIKRMNCLFLIIFLISSGIPTTTLAQVPQNNDSPGVPGAGVGVAPVPEKAYGIDLFTSRIQTHAYDRV